MTKTKKEPVKTKAFESQEKYRLANQTPVTLKFHNDRDKDILDYFKTQPSKLETVRKAVREYMVKDHE